MDRAAAIRATLLSATVAIALFSACRGTFERRPQIETSLGVPLVRAEWTSGLPGQDTRVIHWTLEVEPDRTGQLDVDGRTSTIVVSEEQEAELLQLVESQRFFELRGPGSSVPCGETLRLEVRLGGRWKSVGGPCFRSAEEQARFDAVWDLVASWVEPALSAGDAPR